MGPITVKQCLSFFCFSLSPVSMLSRSVSVWVIFKSVLLTCLSLTTDQAVSHPQVLIFLIERVSTSLSVVSMVMTNCTLLPLVNVWPLPSQFDQWSLCSSVIKNKTVSLTLVWRLRTSLSVWQFNMSNWKFDLLTPSVLPLQVFDSVPLSLTSGQVFLIHWSVPPVNPSIEVGPVLSWFSFLCSSVSFPHPQVTLSLQVSMFGQLLLRLIVLEFTLSLTWIDVWPVLSPLDQWSNCRPPSGASLPLSRLDHLTLSGASGFAVPGLPIPLFMLSSRLLEVWPRPRQFDQWFCKPLMPLSVKLMFEHVALSLTSGQTVPSLSHWINVWPVHFKFDQWSNWSACSLEFSFHNLVLNGTNHSQTVPLLLLLLSLPCFNVV